MPRRIFPAGSVTNTTGNPLRLAFHKTSTAGVREADLWAVDSSGYTSSPIPNGIVLTDASGNYSAFAGPDDVDFLWVAPHTGASRTQITATSTVANGATIDGNGRSISGNQFLYQADHLRRWWGKLGDVAYTQATIGCFGDSVTAGAYANDVAATTDWSLWRSRGWVGQLRTMIEARYGAVGELLNATDGTGSTNPYSVLSSAFIGSPAACGINSSRLVFTGSSQTATLTLPACTTIEVFYYWRTSVLTSAAIRYNLDGAGLTTAPTQSEVDGTTYSFSLTGLANTTHTLVLQGPSSNNAEIIAVGCWTNTDTGIRVDRRAKSGARFDTAFAIANPTSTLSSGDQTRQFNSVSSGLRTDLAIICLSANQPTDTTHNPTTASFATSVQAAVDAFVAKGSCVLLVGGPSTSISSRPSGHGRRPWPVRSSRLRRQAKAGHHLEGRPSWPVA
jgi:hypothetical protein